MRRLAGSESNDKGMGSSGTEGFSGVLSDIRGEKADSFGSPLRYAKTNKNEVIGTLCQEI
jgi:hypothetical protein